MGSKSLRSEDICNYTLFLGRRIVRMKYGLTLKINRLYSKWCMSYCNRMFKKNMPIEKVYLLVGIPSIKRLTTINLEKHKQTNDLRHLMHGQTAITFRSKSRKSFLKVSHASWNDPSQSRTNTGKDITANISGWIEPPEHLPPWHESKWRV